MCETFFIDKTESERIAIANELKNEIDKGEVMLTVGGVIQKASNT